jgi:hypothetical protein
LSNDLLSCRASCGKGVVAKEIHNRPVTSDLSPVQNLFHHYSGNSSPKFQREARRKKEGRKNRYNFLVFYSFISKLFAMPNLRRISRQVGVSRDFSDRKGRAPLMIE